MFSIKAVSAAQRPPQLYTTGFWTFEGNFNDTGAGGVAALSTLTAGTGTSISTAIYANGTSSMLTTSTALGATSTRSLTIPGNFTLEFFVYKTAHTTTSATMFNTRTSTNDLNKVSLVLNNSGTRFQFIVGTGTSTTTLIDAVITVMPLFTWAHVVLERTGTSTRIFYNGNSVGSTTSFLEPLEGAFSLGASLFESSSPNNNRPWNGYMDDSKISPVSVYNGSNFTPPVYTGPITQALYNFDADYNDQSSFARHLSPGAGVSLSGGAMSSAAQSSLGATSAATFNISGNFTIECWIFGTAWATTFNTVFGTRTTAGDAAALDFGVNTTGTRWQIVGNGATLVNAVVAFSLNQWIHLCVERSGSTLTAYVNGSSVGSATYTQSIARTVRIGAAKFASTSPSNSRGFAGSIDDVRITTNAVRYGGNFTPPSIGTLS